MLQEEAVQLGAKRWLRIHVGFFSFPSFILDAQILSSRILTVLSKLTIKTEKMFKFSFSFYLFGFNDSCVTMMSSIDK